MRLASIRIEEDAMAKTADVVIIGAGVMGASIAFNLVRRGVTNVVVLEKNFIAAGALLN
jgi:sarcosine oxidase subunit beta